MRGVWLYNGDVFAWRDNAGGTALVMHKATAGGWVAVTLTPFIPFNAGTANIAEGTAINNGSGATATVLRVALASGDWGGTPQASGRLYVSGVTGTWAASNPMGWRNNQGDGDRRRKHANAAAGRHGRVRQLQLLRLQQQLSPVWWMVQPGVPSLTAATSIS